MTTDHTPAGGAKVLCTKCNMEVTPKEDGTCPGCGTKIA